jgi:GTPase SAR1 family protein
MLVNYSGTTSVAVELIKPCYFHRNIVLLLVGLDNAGKTTAAKNLVGGK